MERVKRKECDTWKIVDSAHEAGFILTLVVDNFHIFLGFAILYVWVLFQVNFLDVSKFPSYSQTGYRSLEKGFHCEDSLLHVFAPAPLPHLLPLPNSPPLLLGEVGRARRACATLARLAQSGRARGACQVGAPT